MLLVIFYLHQVCLILTHQAEMVTVAAVDGLQVPLRTAKEMFPVGLPVKHHLNINKNLTKTRKGGILGFLIIYYTGYFYTENNKKYDI